VTLARTFPVKLDLAGIAVFILLRRNHWCDLHVEKRLVDAFGPTAFVARVADEVKFVEEPPRERPDA